MTRCSTPDLPTSYQEIYVKGYRKHQLLAVHWDLTYRCNERCSHCYLDVNSSPELLPGELTTAECIGVIDQLEKLGVLNLTLSAARFSSAATYSRIAEYARSKRFLLRLFTNGILIRPETAAHIAALHPFGVEISIYAQHLMHTIESPAFPIRLSARRARCVCCASAECARRSKPS